MLCAGACSALAEEAAQRLRVWQERACIAQRACQAWGRPCAHSRVAACLVQGQRPEGVLMPEPAVQAAPALLARLQREQQQQQPGAGEAARQQHGADGPQQREAQREGLEPYLVPACAAWFRWDAIAEVEEAHFKDFLGQDGANPERYRQYRNAIINKYRCAASCAWACLHSSRGAAQQFHLSAPAIPACVSLAAGLGRLSPNQATAQQPNSPSGMRRAPACSAGRTPAAS